MLTNFYSFLSPGIQNGGSTKTQPRTMPHRIKRFAPAFAVLACLGGCAVYPDGGPAYGGGYYGYGGGPAVVQPEVSIGIGGASGPAYYDQRRGYGPGYHGQPGGDERRRADNGAHSRPGDSGQRNPSQQGNASGGITRGGAPAGRPGDPRQQTGNNGGPRGDGNGSGSGGGNNRASGYGYGYGYDYGQHSNSH
jgi:hypothetical protein